MAKYIYLYCKRCNISGSVTTAAYSSRKKAMAEYNNMLQNKSGQPVNYVTKEDTENYFVKRLAQYGDKLLGHFYMGPSNGNTSYESHYVIRKELN